MKKLLILIALSLGAVGPVGAVTFNSWDYANHSALEAMPHGTPVTWGINWNLPAGQTITGATLTILGFYDWTTESNNLFVQLLNSAPLGVQTLSTNTGSGNYFTGNGTQLTNLVNVGTSPVNYPVNFTSAQLTALTSAVSDGNFGFGFDPHCHFYDTGVTFTITTASVPDSGSSLLLLGLGFLALCGLSRRWLRA
jgi:hypothetical protein